MNNLLRTFSVIVIALAFSAAASAQQWGYGPVIVFDQRDGMGNANSFGVGEFRNNQSEFGSLGNDSARSVTVPNGYRVRFCENEGKNGAGSGKCEEFAEGNHNLRYGGSASYIRVWGPAPVGGGGWSGGGQLGVTIFEDGNQGGRSQQFGIGRYLNMNGGLGNLRNDRASSVEVARWFRVRLCESEGNDGRGGGRCEEYGEGRFNLRYNDEASFVEVTRVGGWGNWGGGNWGNNNNRDIPLVVYSDKNQRGDSQPFYAGTFRNDQGQFGQLRNDEASSITVARGYRVRLCENESQNGSGRCEEYGEGSFNLRYNDSASFIRVWRSLR